MQGILDRVKKYWAIILVVLGVVAIGYVGYGCGKRSRDGEVAELATKLATSDHTIEVQKNLYATQTQELDIQKVKVSALDETVKDLLDKLDKAEARALTLDGLVVKWKKAYEGAVNAHQTDGGTSPTDPAVTRKRVDFDKDFGYIGVSGYTLTDPAEGFVSVRQLRPLKLGLAVTKNRDGTWSSYVSSSEDNVGVDVSVSAVDLSVVRQTWRQRIWVEGGVDFLMGQRASLGLSYHFDRYSVGANCSAWSDGHGCGLTVGFRPFK